MRELTLHLSGSAEGPYQRSIQTGIGRGPDGFEHEYSCKERNVFFDIKACVSSNRISTDFG